LHASKENIEHGKKMGESSPLRGEYLGGSHKRPKRGKILQQRFFAVHAKGSPEKRALDAAQEKKRETGDLQRRPS